MPRQASQNPKGNGRTVRKGRKNKSKGSSNGPALITGKDFGNATTIKEASAPLFRSREVRRLRFYEPVSYGLTAGAINSYVFMANGLFDPNSTGGTRQPMGFDTMMLSFNHYCVLKAKMTVTAQSGISIPTTVAIAISATSTPLTSVEQVVDSGAIVMETLENKATTGSTRVLQCAVDIRKTQGMNNVIDDDTLRGTSAANPTEGTYFIIYGWNTQGVSGNLYFDVIIDYVAMFMEPRNLPLSLQKTLKLLIANEPCTCKCKACSCDSKCGK